MKFCRPPATLLAWPLLAAAPRLSCRQWSPGGKTVKGWSFTTTKSTKLPVATRLDQVPTKHQVGKYALCLSSSCSSLERRALKAGKFPLSITVSSKMQMESAANTGPKSHQITHIRRRLPAKPQNFRIGASAIRLCLSTTHPSLWSARWTRKRDCHVQSAFCFLQASCSFLCTRKPRDGLSKQIHLLTFLTARSRKESNASKKMEVSWNFYGFLISFFGFLRPCVHQKPANLSNSTCSVSASSASVALDNFSGAKEQDSAQMTSNSSIPRACRTLGLEYHPFKNTQASLCEPELGTLSKRLAAETLAWQVVLATPCDTLTERCGRPRQQRVDSSSVRDCVGTAEAQGTQP